MNKFTIRRMTENDLDRIHDIEKECFTDPWSLESFKSDLNNNMAYPLVVVSDKEIAGYSCLYIVSGEMQIGNFAVAKEYQGHGLGKMMMSEIIKLANDRSSEAIYLEVRESNTPAVNLYKAYGFRPVGRRKNYYRSPMESAIVMAKELLWSTGSTVPKKVS